MKQSFLLLFLLLLISSSKFSATSLATKHGQADHQETSLKEISIDHEVVSLDELMGLEDCTGKEDDEECLKRRMTSEAHLDYIYTQHHKP